MGKLTNQRKRSENVLANGDVFYEGQRREFSFFEMQQQTVDLPFPIQDFLGDKVADVFRKGYGVFSSKNPGVPYEDYLRTNGVYNWVLGQRINVSKIAGTKFGEDALGDFYPELKSVKTVSDAANLLFRANLGGFMAGAQEGKGLPKEEKLGYMAQSFYEQLPFYERGKGKASFAYFQQRKAYNLISDRNRVEAEAQSISLDKGIGNLDGDGITIGDTISDNRGFGAYGYFEEAPIAPNEDIIANIQKRLSPANVPGRVIGASVPIEAEGPNGEMTSASQDVFFNIAKPTLDDDPSIRARAGMDTTRRMLNAATGMSADNLREVINSTPGLEAFREKFLPLIEQYQNSSGSIDIEGMLSEIAEQDLYDLADLAESGKPFTLTDTGGKEHTFSGAVGATRDQEVKKGHWTDSIEAKLGSRSSVKSLKKGTELSADTSAQIPTDYLVEAGRPLVDEDGNITPIYEGVRKGESRRLVAPKGAPGNLQRLMISADTVKAYREGIDGRTFEEGSQQGKYANILRQEINRADKVTLGSFNDDYVQKNAAQEFEDLQAARRKVFDPKLGENEFWYEEMDKGYSGDDDDMEAGIGDETGGNSMKARYERDAAFSSGATEDLPDSSPRSYRYLGNDPASRLAKRGVQKGWKGVTAKGVLSKREAGMNHAIFGSFNGKNEFVKTSGSRRPKPLEPMRSLVKQDFEQQQTPHMEMYENPQAESFTIQNVKDGGSQQPSGGNTPPEPEFGAHMPEEKYLEKNYGKGDDVILPDEGGNQVPEPLSGARNPLRPNRELAQNNFTGRMAERFRNMQKEIGRERMAAAQKGRAYSYQEMRLADEFQKKTYAGAYAAAKLQPRDLVGFGDLTYGQVKSSLKPVGKNGEYERTVDMRDEDGNVTVSQGEFAKGFEIGRSAIANVSLEGLPSKATDAAGTIKKRVREMVNKELDHYEKSLSSSGEDPDVSRQIKERIGTVAKEVTKRGTNMVMNELGINSHEAGIGGSKQFHATPVYNKEKLEGLMGRFPEIKSEVERLGGADAVLKSDGLVLSAKDGDTPLSFQMGGGGGRGNRGGGGGNFSDSADGSLFGGKYGKMFYGAYMMKRAWSMGAGPVMQEADWYGNYISSIGSLGMYGDAGKMLSTDAGYAARQALSKEYFAKGSYENFGAFKDVGYLASGYGDGFARLASSARVGGTVAASGIVTSQMLKMSGVSAIAGIAKFLPQLSLGIGAGVVGGTIAMEAMNAAGITEDASWGSVFRGVEKGFVYSNAYQRALNKGLGSPRWLNGYEEGSLSGITEEEILSQMTNEERIIYQYSDDPRVEATRNIGKTITAITGEGADQAKTSAYAMTRAFGHLPTTYQAEAFSNFGITTGRSVSQGVSEAQSYASQSGYIVGSTGFERAMLSYADTSISEADREKMGAKSSRLSSIGSQIQNYFEADQSISNLIDYKQSGAPAYEEKYFGQYLADKYDIATSQQAGQLTSYLSAYSSYMGTPSNAVAENLAASSQMQSSYASGVVSQMMQLGGSYGMDPSAIASSFAGISDNDARVGSYFMNGDLQGISFEAAKVGNSQYQFYDQSRNPIWETNGSVAIQMVQGWGGQLGSLRLDGMSVGSAAKQLLGTGDDKYLQSFLSGGTRQMRRDAANEAYNSQMALAGIQLQGIALSEQFYWGSGSWSNPSSGSSWGIEDQMRSMQYQSQQTDFEDSRNRMALSNSYSIRREENSLQRMNISQGYNTWQMDFNYNTSLQSRDWAKEDWQYQDTVSNLNFSWGMEDVNDAIRYSSGRQRKKYIEQRNRMTISESLRSEQTDETRDRQEEVWANEDLRFQKQKEYTEELNRLDQESFSLNREQREELFRIDNENLDRQKKEYEEQYALQEKLTELQRKHQYEQLELQKQSANISAGAAATAKEWADKIDKVETGFSDVMGKISNIAAYEKASFVMDGFIRVLYAMGAVNLAQWNELVQSLNGYKTNARGSGNWEDFQ